MARSPEWLVGGLGQGLEGSLALPVLVSMPTSICFHRLYVHSAVNNWKKCLHSIKLKDSVLSLVYVTSHQGLGVTWGPKWPGQLTAFPF